MGRCQDSLSAFTSQKRELRNPILGDIAGLPLLRAGNSSNGDLQQRRNF